MTGLRLISRVLKTLSAIRNPCICRILCVYGGRLMMYMREDSFICSYVTQRIHMWHETTYVTNVHVLHGAFLRDMTDAHVT